jgi:predicted deacylase
MSLLGYTNKTQPEAYVIRGDQKGPCLMVIGGIHGDEPSGSKAAMLYRNAKLKKGTLILVPKANQAALIKNKRFLGHDMNRLFADNDYKGYEKDVVEKMKSLMKGADALLNLHEGSGFFSKDKNSFGQSIVVDERSQMAEVFVSVLNSNIKNVKYHFGLNDEKHDEQKLSATYYAHTKLGIPAFGVEVSKDIKDPTTKIALQCKAIRVFAEQLGLTFNDNSLAFYSGCNI